MKVLHFFKTFFPDSYGGVEQVIYQICRGTACFDIKADVLSLSKNKMLAPVNIDGHYSYRAKQHFDIASTSISFSVFSEFKKLAQQADIIHYHFPWPMMDIIHLSSKINKPTVVTYHSDVVKQKYLLNFYRPLQNHFLKNVDKIVATSPNYIESSDVLSSLRDKTVSIPIGLDKASYPTPNFDRVAYWKHKFGDTFFLFIGVLRYYKGLHILIEAASGVEQPIVIAGEGPFEKDLKDQAQRLGLKNVHFIGKVSDEDKVALLISCFSFVFPSNLRSEAFGVSLLEAAMYGKPLISTEIGTGTSYINVDGKTGLVIAPNAPEQLKQAMLKLSQNSKMAKQMGEAAEKRYWELFTAKNMAKKYSNLYRELLIKK
jgi:rhamnosyl/mannosyltransferase